MELHAFADVKIEHAGVGSKLLSELRSHDDPVVEVDEFGLGELLDVDGHA